MPDTPTHTYTYPTHTHIKSTTNNPAIYLPLPTLWPPCLEAGMIEFDVPRDWRVKYLLTNLSSFILFASTYRCAKLLFYFMQTKSVLNWALELSSRDNGSNWNASSCWWQVTGRRLVGYGTVLCCMFHIKILLNEEQKHWNERRNFEGRYQSECRHH